MYADPEVAIAMLGTIVTVLAWAVMLGVAGLVVISELRRRS